MNAVPQQPMVAWCPLIDGGGRWLLEKMGKLSGPRYWGYSKKRQYSLVKAIALQRCQTNATFFALFREPSAGPGEMAQQLRVLPALAVDPSLVSIIYAVQHNHLQLRLQGIRPPF